MCVLSAADVFDQSDEDGLVILLNERPDERETARVTEAAHRCPSQAIRIEQLGSVSVAG